MYAQPLLLLLESLRLFLFFDLSAQLAVDAALSATALILQAVLDDTGGVSEQTERGKRCRPVSVDTNAVDELYGILIAMLGGKMKIVHRLSEAYSLENFSAERMIEGLKSGELDVDIRLGVYASGDRKGKPHDNGTAIRVSSKKLDECFDKKKKLL